MVFHRVAFDIRLQRLAGASERQFCSDTLTVNRDPLSAKLRDEITTAQKKGGILDAADPG
jgi:hypothetical protein